MLCARCGKPTRYSCSDIWDCEGNLIDFKIMFYGVEIEFTRYSNLDTIKNVIDEVITKQRITYFQIIHMKSGEIKLTMMNVYGSWKKVVPKKRMIVSNYLPTFCRTLVRKNK